MTHCVNLRINQEITDDRSITGVTFTKVTHKSKATITSKSTNKESNINNYFNRFNYC